MHASVRILPLLVGAMLAVACASPAQEVDRDVPYVPTPPEVVDAMLRVANVGPDDFLIDLGSGDGRIVIRAAEEFGARGFGVDIDPELVAVANRTARSAGLADRVEFAVENLFETDIRRASVVTLYLLPTINLQLRPRLLRELQPGTRVVSHAFDMYEWEPDEKLEVEGRRIYYWVVPADVAGGWRWSVGAGGQERSYGVRLNQDFQKVTGSTTRPADGVHLREATLVGDQLTLVMVDRRDGEGAVMRYAGRVRGNAVTGTVTVEEGPLRGTYAWNATRTLARGTETGSSPGT
jgi:hypothetical protein